MYRHLFPSLLIHLLVLAIMAYLPSGLPADKAGNSPISVKMIPASEFGQKKQSKSTSTPKDKKNIPPPVPMSNPPSKKAAPLSKTAPLLQERPDNLLAPSITPQTSAPSGPLPLTPQEPELSRDRRRPVPEEIPAGEGNTMPREGRSRGGAGSQPSGESIALYDPSIVNWSSISKKQTIPEITLDTAEFKQLGYLYKLKDRIEQAWQYPLSAMRLGMTGDLYIRFVIQKDGSLREVKLLRTSGNPVLDEAALQAVKDAAPFLPLPKHWKADQFAIKGHFVYSLSGRQIM